MGFYHRQRRKRPNCTVFQLQRGPTVNCPASPAQSEAGMSSLLSPCMASGDTSYFHCSCNQKRPFTCPKRSLVKQAVSPILLLCSPHPRQNYFFLDMSKNFIQVGKGGGQSPGRAQIVSEEEAVASLPQSCLGAEPLFLFTQPFLG